jgi:hypothetical protein
MDEPQYPHRRKEDDKIALYPTGNSEISGNPTTCIVILCIPLFLACFNEIPYVVNRNKISLTSF